ncbi:MAG: LysE family translocator [Pseudomonadota bacterium]
MTSDTLFALALFALVASITPGPNNLMMMASGANFGLRRTIPHMLGVGLGFIFMLLVVGAGLVNLFARYPLSYTIMKVVSAAYLVFLAWKIATAAPLSETAKTGSPFSFLQAAAFQWVNPKAWVMALSAISIYSPDHRMSQVVIVALVFGVVNVPCATTWVVSGQQLRRLLTNPSRLRGFNILMAVLLVASLVPVLMPDLLSANE